MILLVDNNYRLLQDNKKRLEAEGHEVITSDNQRETEQIILKLKPDLAIFELILENTDSGFILSYKTKKQYPEIPVIIYTSVAEKTGFTFSINAEQDKKWIKADYYFEKGRDDINLMETINNLLQGKSKSKKHQYI